MLDYPGGPNLITWALKSRELSGGRRDGARKFKEIQSMKRTWQEVAVLKMESHHEEEFRQSEGSERDSWPTASKETDLRPATQITEFCQQPGWAWKPACPQSLQIRVQLANNLISACDTWASGTSGAHQTLDLQSCEIISLRGVKLLNLW